MSTDAQREAVRDKMRRMLPGAPDASVNFLADEIIAAYEAAAPYPPTRDEIAKVAQELFATPKGLLGRLANQPQQTQESYLARAREAIRAVRSLSWPALSSAPPKDPAP